MLSNQPLVGLAGPWISGGIEFNWPQHHRPSTYAPVDYLLKENPDGSCTVHLSEIDKMYGTKGIASITLYPGKAYIEIKGRLYNNTDLPQTLPLVGKPGGSRQRSHLLRLPAGRQRCYGPRKTGSLHLPHRHRGIL
ncbi:MAG: DUF5107 domain-containing protein [Lachnospiraceae bacterium]